jgi:plastocyanin
MRRWIVRTTLALLAGAATAGTISATVTARGLRTPQDVLVFVEKVGDNNFKPPQKNAEMDQKNLLFIPYILPVVVGTTVDFLNSDAVLHNVFTPDAVADKFNLGTWPKGQVKSYTFKRPGAAVMLCNVHPEMEAYVVALRNPYFDVADKAGKVRIPPLDKKTGKATLPELPAGTYRVWSWHPKLKSVVQEVSVSAQGEASVAFALARGKPEDIAKLLK